MLLQLDFFHSVSARAHSAQVTRNISIIDETFNTHGANRFYATVTRNLKSKGRETRGANNVKMVYSKFHHIEHFT